MRKPLVAAFFWLAIASGAAATAPEPGTIGFDNWLSLQRNTDHSAQWEYQPRFYVPFSLSRGWTFTQRIDLPVSYTDAVGTGNQPWATPAR